MTDRVPRHNTRCCPKSARIRPRKTLTTCQLEIRGRFHKGAMAVRFRLPPIAEMNTNTARRTLPSRTHPLARYSVPAQGLAPLSSQCVCHTCACGLPYKGFLPAPPAVSLAHSSVAVLEAGAGAVAGASFFRHSDRVRPQSIRRAIQPSPRIPHKA